ARLFVTEAVREPVAEKGIRFVRRHDWQGHHYFLVNRSDRPVDDWVTLGTPAASAVLFDPLSADKGRKAAVIHPPGERAMLYLQLQPGESRILRTFARRD